MSSLWDLYQSYVVELDSVLFDMGRVHGTRIDRDAQNELRTKIEGEIQSLSEQIQDLVPRELKPRKHYKRDLPEGVDFDPVLVPGKEKACSKCGIHPITKGEHINRGGKKNPCHDADIVLIDTVVEEWDVVEPFNPLSNDQLKAYVKAHGHPLGHNHKNKNPESLDDLQLKKLSRKYGTKFPFYGLVRQMKGKSKVQSTYLWVPDERDYIYGWFTHNPETFRLAMKDYNLMNVPHRGDAEFSHEIRRTVIASPGCLLVEGDSASIEAVFTGYFMQSKEYMELAKRGIHAIWTCHSLGLEPTPENIRYVKNAPEHEKLYRRKKKTVHSVSYGRTAKGLYEENEDLFDSEADAQREINEFYAFAPDLLEWHKDLRDFAHKHGYIQSPWGLKNYYYQVYRREHDKFTGGWRWVLGEDGRPCIAFLPQHANGMFQRENLKIIGGTWARPYMPAHGHVHDSIGLDCPEDLVDKAIDLLAETMNRPIVQLGGLQVGVEIKVGKNWDDMKSVKVV